MAIRRSNAKRQYMPFGDLAEKDENMKSTIAIAFSTMLALSTASQAAQPEGASPPRGGDSAPTAGAPASPASPASAAAPVAALKVEDWTPEKVVIKAQRRSANKPAAQSARPQHAPE
jgi:hypothetical protein